MNFVPQYLKSGLALCGKAFPRFVQTFNWLVDATSNLKGDADCGADGGGRITVDKTDFAHPVIRCTGCNGGGGGVTPAISSANESAWMLTVGDNGAFRLDNCYWMAGGEAKECGALSGTDTKQTGERFICVEFDLTDSGAKRPTATVLDTISSIKVAQQNMDKYVVPMWILRTTEDEDGEKTTTLVDLRTMAYVQVFDFIGGSS